MSRFDPHRAGWWLLGLTLVALVGSAWIHEDAYITFRVIDNFLDGHGLRWNLAERVQVYTHPLWLFVLLPWIALTGEYYFTTLALTVGLSLVTFYLVVFRAGVSVQVGSLAAFALLLSKAYMDYATTGLEDSLTRLLLVGFVLLWSQSISSESISSESPAGPRPSNPARHVLGLSLLAALTTLNRPDTLLLFVPALGYLAIRTARQHSDRSIWQSTWRSTWRPSARFAALVALGFLPLALWGFFAFFYYGFPFPNTAYAKLGMGVPRPWLLIQSGFFLVNSLLRDPITLAVILGAGAVAVARRHPAATPLAAGSLLYLAYVVWIGGGYMSGRLLSAPFFLAVLALAQYPLGRGWRHRPYVALLVIAVALVPRIYLPFILSEGGRLDAHGIGDERRLYYPFTGFLVGLGQSRWPDHFFRDEGEAAKDGPPVQVAGTVGMFGFFAGPDVHVVDWHGLTEPLLARLPAIITGPWVNAHPTNWRPGHGWRPIPAGYLESLESGENCIEDPSLALYYQKLHRVTRGDLWSWERLQTAWRLNLGRFDPLRDEYVGTHPEKFDRFPPSRWNSGPPGPPGSPPSQPPRSPP